MSAPRFAWLVLAAACGGAPVLPARQAPPPPPPPGPPTAPSPTLAACPELPGSRAVVELQHLNEGQRAARERALAAEMPGWHVTLDPDSGGWPLSVNADPSLVDAGHDLTDAEIARVDDLLAQHRDVFGLVDPSRQQLVRVSASEARLVQQLEGGVVIASLDLVKVPFDGKPQLGLTGHLLPIGTCARVDAEPAIARLVGKRYVVHTEWWRRQLDCYMGGCDSKPVRSEDSQVVVARADVQVTHGLAFVDHGKVTSAHHVLCIDLDSTHLPWPTRTATRGDLEPQTSLKPLGDAPDLPVVFDALDGRPIDDPGACQVLRTQRGK